MNDEQLMIQTFCQSYNKYLYDKCVIGKLACQEFKDNLKKGTEIDIVMPAMVQLFDYTGGDLAEAEEAGTSHAKIRIDKGKAFHFYIDEVKKQEIADAPDVEQKVKLAKQYCDDAIEQFAAAVDTEYGKLWANAGHYLAGSADAAITLSSQTAKDIFAYMQSEFQRGDDKGHTNWVDGKMVAIVPPEYQFYLGKLDDLKYVESGHKKIEKGFIGMLSGWKILVSNNIHRDADDKDIHYPLFGIAGKTLAGGVQKKLTVKTYEPDNNFNTAYKGYALFGVGSPRADFLGAVKVKAPLSIS